MMAASKQTRRPSAELGLSLVELMISILLATMLVGGVFYMVSGQQRTYSAQLGTMQAQQNLWGALEFLQGQLRRAGFGFGGCDGEIRAYKSGAEIMLRAASFQNGFNLLTGETDPLGADSFQVLYASEDAGSQLGVKIAMKMPSSSANLKVSAPGGIKDQDLVVIWQPGALGSWCSLLQATGDPKAEAGGARYHITHNHGQGKEYNPPGGHNIFPPDGYPIGSVVMRFGGNDSPHSFAIDRSRNPPQLVTWQAADRSDLVVVADGIEDMQIAWACDANRDGTLFEGRTDEERRDPTVDEWAFNVPGDVPPTCGSPSGCIPQYCGDGHILFKRNSPGTTLPASCALTAGSSAPLCDSSVPISLIRLTLVARTTSPMTGDRVSHRPALEDNPAGTASEDLAASGQLGTFQRVVLSASVIPRNIRSAQ